MTPWLEWSVYDGARPPARLGGAQPEKMASRMMALENLAVIEAQIEVLLPAAGNAALERPKHLAELLSAVWVDVVPPMPRQTSRLEAMR